MYQLRQFMSYYLCTRTFQIFYCPEACNVQQIWFSTIEIRLVISEILLLWLKSKEASFWCLLIYNNNNNIQNLCSILYNLYQKRSNFVRWNFHGTSHCMMRTWWSARITQLVSRSGYNSLTFNGNPIIVISVISA